MKFAYILLAFVSFSGQAFAHGSTLAERIERQVRKALKSDIRILMSTEKGNICGAEGNVTTVDVQLAHGERTFDDKTGQVGTKTTWKTITHYYVMTDEAAKGNIDLWGPKNVCLE